MTPERRYTPLVRLGREICGEPGAALRREWLVTNGLGGYAAMSLAGAPTRSYHGYLVAALQPPVGRTVLVAGLAEELTVEGEPPVPLHALEVAPGRFEPAGWRQLESFTLEGTIPAWRFVVGGAVLEKRAWMAHGANATFVRYRLDGGAPGPARLTVRPLVTCRDHHAVRADDRRAPIVTPVPGSRTVAGSAAVPGSAGVACGAAVAWPGETARLQLHGPGATFATGRRQLIDLVLRAETERGEPDRSNLWTVGEFAVTLQPGESWTLVLAAGDDALAAAGADGEAALAAERARLTGLLARADATDAEPVVRQLVLAADQFIVERRIPGADQPGLSVIAGYPWFNDWGRDTMIALPGLALATGRTGDAATILRSFAPWVRDGLLPNSFPDAERAEPAYNTVDAALWYVGAVRACHEATGDEALVDALLPALREIVDRYLGGTRFGIGVDPADGLVRAGVPGLQLTWMDARAGDWVVTPRIGKPVEIQALWVNALRAVAAFCRARGAVDADRAGDAARYEAAADRAAVSFRARFWRPELGFCADVVDGPDGDELALRPNQLLAVSLPEPLLPPDAARSVVAACTRALLVPCGLRSLDPGDPAYHGSYTGDRLARDGAYHRGAAWSWLVGPYVDALVRVGGTADDVRRVLEPFAAHLADAGLGSVSEIFEGDPPHRPAGCFAQAWGVAEVLRVLRAAGR